MLGLDKKKYKNIPLQTQLFTSWDPDVVEIPNKPWLGTTNAHLSSNVKNDRVTQQGQEKSGKCFNIPKISMTTRGDPSLAAFFLALLYPIGKKMED